MSFCLKFVKTEVSFSICDPEKCMMLLNCVLLCVYIGCLVLPIFQIYSYQVLSQRFLTFSGTVPYNYNQD